MNRPRATLAAKAAEPGAFGGRRGDARTPSPFHALQILGAVLGSRARRKAATLIVLTVIGGMLESIGIGLVFPLLKVSMEPSIAQRNETLRLVQAGIGVASVDTFLIVLCGGLLAIIVFKNVFAAYLVNAQSRFVWESRRVLSNLMFRLYLRRDLLFHLHNHSSEVIRNLTVSVDQVFGKFLMPVLLLATEGVVVGFVLAMLMLINPLVTLAAGAVLGATAGAFHLVNRRKIGFWGVDVHDTSAHLLRIAGQCLGGIKEVKIFHKEAFFEREYDSALRRNSHALERYQSVTQYPRLVLETLAAASILVTVALVIGSGNRVQDAVPVVGLFAMAAFRLMPSFNRIIAQVANIRFSLPMVDCLLTEIQSTPLDRVGPTDEAPALPLPFRNSITLRDISFRYPGGRAAVLDHISLFIPFGASIALVGRTGAGKTTVANLLLGLLEPSEGEILIDERRLSASHLRAWQANVGYIPQDVFLLDDTVRANVAFGVPASEIDESRVREAVRMARLDELAGHDGDALDIVIGEKGARLSGGQRQRLGIARALYHDARLLVLDEATSSLDTTTETEITTLLRSLHDRRTLVIIAHRLSTIRHCDQIFVLDNGRIVDVGDFDALTARSAIFREMVAHGRLHEAAEA